MKTDEFERYETLDQTAIIRKSLPRAELVKGTPADKFLSKFELSWGENFTDPSGKNGFWHIPDMEYLDKTLANEPTEYSALACFTRNNKGQMTSLHCHYLDQNGELANVHNPRSEIYNALDCRDRFVRIQASGEGNQVIVLTIGIINGLSIQRMIGDEDVAIWAATDRAAMMFFMPPRSCKAVYMFPSHDYTLEELSAAISLRRKLMGKGSRGFSAGQLPIYIPDEATDSWNDVLKSGRSINLNRKMI